MNEERFITFMIANKKPEGNIKHYLEHVRAFEEYLASHKGGKDVDDATAEDLKSFAIWGVEESINVYRHMWGIRNYYQSVPNENMVCASREVMEMVKMDTRKLKEFPGVDMVCVDKLASMGIKTAKQILDAGRTQKDREELAENLGIPSSCILDLVKLSNLARLPGLKKVRGRLFFDGGLDTLDKIAAIEPEEVKEILQAFIDRTGFEGSSPTLSEADSAVTMARYLPRIVEY
jgi:hypothetical protein